MDELVHKSILTPPPKTSRGQCSTVHLFLVNFVYSTPCFSKERPDNPLTTIPIKA